MEKPARFRNLLIVVISADDRKGEGMQGGIEDLRSKPETFFGGGVQAITQSQQAAGIHSSGNNYKT